MLACDFLLKLLLKSVDFEPFQAQTGQVPIWGFLCAKSPVLFGLSTKSPVLSCLNAKSHVLFSDGRCMDAEKSRTLWLKEHHEHPGAKKYRTLWPKEAP